jgi:hypothetical protein
VLDHLHSERFSDKAPAEVYATLIDEGIYLCSIRTMHRILAENGELKERRNQLRHPQYKKPRESHGRIYRQAGLCHIPRTLPVDQRWIQSLR